MPADVHKELRLSNIKGFDFNEGCRLAKVEMSPQAWTHMSVVWSWLEEKGALRSIARRSTLYEMPIGRPEVSDTIELQRNMGKHVQYSLRMNFEHHGDIATLDKEVETKYKDDRAATPKFLTLRHLYMDLENPETGRPLIEGIVPIPNRPGRYQIMFFNKGSNADYIRKIKKSPSAWWWGKLLDMGLTNSCAQSLMDSFDMGVRVFAHLSTFDPATWEVKLEGGGGARDFADDISDLLSDMSDHDSDGEVIHDPLEFSAEAKEEMLTTIREKEDFEFGVGGEGVDNRSRASDFVHSVGNSTNRSVSSARFAAQKTLVKQMTSELENTKKERDAAKKREEDLLARMSRLETALASQHGSPPVSGGPAAGSTPPSQANGSGGCAAGQG